MAQEMSTAWLADNARDFAPRLLAWYDRQGRQLPWREDTMPYHIWVSEIMLQQTQATTVIPYYQRFIAALPDIDSLAAVSEDALFKLWEGLGYYSRARNLHKCAQTVVARHGGRLPADYQALLALPGIGEYTAGAIASIAYGQPVPAVDGNVLRIFARLLAYGLPVTAREGKALIREMAAAVVSAERPGDFNQALMDLGATVCLPRSQPLCQQCPVAAACRGRALGVAADLPKKAGKMAKKVEKRTILIIEQGDKVLLRKRPAKGLLAGMWELPSLAGHWEREPLLALLEKQGLVVTAAISAGRGKHVFTHLIWEMIGWRISLNSDTIADDEAKWLTWEEIRAAYPLPSAFRAFVPTARQQELF